MNISRRYLAGGLILFLSGLSSRTGLAHEPIDPAWQMPLGIVALLMMAAGVAMIATAFVKGRTERVGKGR